MSEPPEARAMTTRHLRFVDEYVTRLSARDAATPSGLAMISTGAPAGYYVYGLVHPVLDRIFYVGKGLGKRWQAHYKEQAASLGNHGKRAKIRDAGGIPRCIVFADGLEEAAAFQAERALIAAIPGLENLTPGQRTEDERQADAAREVLVELGTIEQFKATGARSEDDVAYYASLLAELQAIIDGKRPNRAVLSIRKLPDGTVERTRKLGDGPWKKVP